MVAPKVTVRVEVPLSPSVFMDYVESFIVNFETWGWFSQTDSARLEALARFIRNTQHELDRGKNKENNNRQCASGEQK